MVKAEKNESKSFVLVNVCSQLIWKGGDEKISYKLILYR